MMIVIGFATFGDENAFWSAAVYTDCEKAMPAKATAQKTMAGASVFDPTTAKCGLVDGGEADGVASSNEMLELMNNHALLMQSSTGGKSLLMYVPWASRARLSTGLPIALALLTE